MEINHLLLFIVTSLVIILFLLPQILSLLGLHPHYKKFTYDFKDKSALIVTTSHQTLGTTGKKTGIFSSEVTIPYYEFFDSGINVHIASIAGGNVPVESLSLMWPVKTYADKRFYKDTLALEKLKNSKKIDNLDFKNYDIIYIAGGWGAAYDLGQSKILGKKISEAYFAKKILSSVCHGALGFVQATDPNGIPLVKNKTLTAVTNKQIKELGIRMTPLHPETELKKLGANFKSNRAIQDVLATCVIVDGNFVTGQNQNSSGATAQATLKLLSKNKISKIEN